jgi:NADH pyrophosphatase NudC (nudix superfamily)
MKYCPLCGRDLILREIEGESRLACADRSCEYVFWDSPIPVLAALVEYRGNVLLARNHAWPRKMYGLITGFLEKGESPEKGALREVKEELGLSGRIGRLIGVYAFFEMNQLIIAYHVIADGEIILGEELAEVKHVPPEKLKPWPMGTGYAVKDWLKMRTGTE